MVEVYLKWMSDLGTEERANVIMPRIPVAGDRMLIDRWWMVVMAVCLFPQIVCHVAISADPIGDSERFGIAPSESEVSA